MLPDGGVLDASLDLSLAPEPPTKVLVKRIFPEVLGARVGELTRTSSTDGPAAYVAPHRLSFDVWCPAAQEGVDWHGLQPARRGSLRLLSLRVVAGVAAPSPDDHHELTPFDGKRLITAFDRHHHRLSLGRPGPLDRLPDRCPELEGVIRSQNPDGTPSTGLSTARCS